MTDILIRYPQGDLADKSGWDNVTREEEIGRMHAGQGMLGVTRSKKRQRLELSSECLEVMWLCWHLDLGLLVSRTMRE